MLDDGYSAENCLQTVMRSGSLWVGREGEFLKEKVHIVDFNSDRMLKCYIEYSTVISKYTRYESAEFSRKCWIVCQFLVLMGVSLLKWWW